MKSQITNQAEVLVIAEIGVNHNGDVELAKQLIDAAKCSGADIAKFQVFRAESLITEAAPAAEYQKKNIREDVSHYEMLKSLELSERQFEELADYCNQVGIEFMASGFSNEDIEVIVRLGAQRLKIPSGEITNLPFLRAVARHNLPAIMSTGMATLDEVSEAIQALTEAGLEPRHLAILHCTTDYPTHPSDVNLRVIPMLREELKFPVGYSDHTESTAVAGAAVAMGASLIEKHLTLDRELPGPDHRASLEPDQFSEMVAHIRAIEQAIGCPEKLPTPAEIKNRLVARKSIVASRSILRGEILGDENLSTKRPGSGLTPMLWDAICGQTAARDYEPNELIDQ